MQETTISARPSGWFGLLYDRAAAYSDDPLSEIEDKIHLAYREGVIDRKDQIFVQYMLPLKGFEYKTLEELVQIFDFEVIESQRTLEFKIYKKLKRYLTKEEESTGKEDTRQFYNIGEASRILGVTPQTTRKWANRGYITSYQVGPRGLLWFDMEEIDNYYENVRTQNANKNKL